MDPQKEKKERDNLRLRPMLLFCALAFGYFTIPNAHFPHPNKIPSLSLSLNPCRRELFILKLTISYSNILLYNISPFLSPFSFLLYPFLFSISFMFRLSSLVHPMPVRLREGLVYQDCPMLGGRVIDFLY